MDTSSVIIYGIIQGLTEFLPISSSAHLALLPSFLHIPDPGVNFDLAMHAGTALAVICYFIKDILFLVKKRNHLFNLIVATVATFILAVVLKKYSLAYGRLPELMAFNMFFFGVLLWIADAKGANRLGIGSDKMQQNKQLHRSVAIGLFQALALFPGVSRSGSTLIVSRLVGLSRREGARFSFLLSLPLIMAGFVYRFPEMSFSSVYSISDCLLGGAVSFVTGFVCIHFFLEFVQRIGLWIFAVYRIILAALIVVFLC